MDQSSLLKRCQVIANMGEHSSFSATEVDAPGQSSGDWGPEDAIGFFQHLRPHGHQVKEIFSDVAHGDELVERLGRVYKLAGDPKRPDGARDAYFVVRQPIRTSPELIEHAGKTWLQQLAMLDDRIGSGQIKPLVESGPRIRVLEGQPPKHPRRDEERCPLLSLIQAFSASHIDPLEPQQGTALALRRAYYFIACDATLCDYLMWPIYRELVGLEDPFEPYFTLWQAGVKWRIFNDQSVDFYIPRQ